MESRGIGELFFIITTISGGRLSKSRIFRRVVFSSILIFLTLPPGRRVISTMTCTFTFQLLRLGIKAWGLSSWVDFIGWLILGFIRNKVKRNVLRFIGRCVFDGVRSFQFWDIEV